MSCSLNKTTLYNVCSVYRGMFSISRGVQYVWGIPWVHRGISWVHQGFQYKWKAFINFLPHMNHDIPPMYRTSLDIPWCTHDIPSTYSWYLPDVLNIPRCTHGIPPMYSWYPLDVLIVSPRCTHGIPRCTKHPDVLSIPRCTEFEHTLYRMKTIMKKLSVVDINCHDGNCVRQQHGTILNNLRLLFEALLVRFWANVMQCNFHGYCYKFW